MTKLSGFSGESMYVIFGVLATTRVRRLLQNTPVPNNMCLYIPFSTVTSIISLFGIL